jgi:hemolysin activation/secretion protein
MVWLLAQLIAPPLQPGPVRLPEQAPLQERSPVATPRQQGPILEGAPAPTKSDQEQRPSQAPASAPSGAEQPLPSLEGSTPYGRKQLRTILKGCLQSSNAPDEALRNCAAALTTRLVRDGYVNSRVYVRSTPAPGRLEVVEGRIAEVRVRSSDSSLERRLSRRLRPLVGTVLNLPQLEERLVALRGVPGVGQIRGNLGRLGSDPTQAVLNLTVEAAAIPWLGEVSVRNDGNAGTGEWRSIGIALKNDLLTAGDSLLMVGEINADQEAELGATIASISYTLPLNEQLKFTGSFGYSRRNLVEATSFLHGYSFRQFQGYGQLEWVIKENSRQRWSLFAGISGNRTDNFLNGFSLSGITPSGWGQTGYARLGTSLSASNGKLSWSGNVYGLQGMPSFSTTEQLQVLGQAGVVPGEARALGGLVNLNWFMAPGLLLSLRGAAQVAFSPLTPSMGFVIGSDTGIKGLPGTLVSGDNGYLWTSELTWTFWTNRRQALQLVPFIGSGGIQFSRSTLSVSDTVGSTGVLLRWLAGRQWALELGWISPFDTEERPFWNQWMLSSGVYSKIQYRF